MKQVTSALSGDELLNCQAARLGALLPELNPDEQYALAHCLLRCRAVQEAVTLRSVAKKHAGRKPNYSIAVLLVDIVRSGLVPASDLDRLASGSFWEERPLLADATNSKINRLEKLARTVLDELGVHSASLQTQARTAKKFMK